MASSSMPPPVTEALDLSIYFPEGRVAGAPVILAVADVFPRSGLAVVQARLGDGLVARFSRLEATDWRDRDFWIQAVLERDGTIHAVVFRNVSMFDFGDCRYANVVLCPDQPPPEPVFTPRFGRIAPAATLWLAPSAPPGPLSISATADGAPVALDVGLAVETVYVRPVSAFPPGSSVVVDVSSTLDVLGRPFTMSAPVGLLTVTEVVTDFTFDTAPPAGAIAGIFATGGLTLGRAMGTDAWMGLIGLSEPPAGTATARIQIGTVGVPSRGALVDARGVASAFALPTVTEAGLVEEVTVPVPGPGPLWLSLDHDLARWHPQRGPFRYGLGAVQLDEIAFE